jgi:hypothetical protein
LHSGDDVSPLAPLVAGVAQGSPISPLCFSLFIDDMTEVLEFSKYHMYADDLQIYHSRYSLRKLTVAFNAWVKYVYRNLFDDHISLIRLNFGLFFVELNGISTGMFYVFFGDR